MNPVASRIPHSPKNGKIGDCLRACVASVLNLRYEDVPHFMDRDGEVNEDYWNVELCEWAERLEMQPVFILPPFEFQGYSVVTGTTRDKSILHSVVYRGSKMVFDPSPEKFGILKVVDIILFVPLDPGLTFDK